ncbi:hypothetical protein [Promicromonospora iranensis]|uniref:Uncharacterized protein n=1 Tax=Promicromonospora iranensis TaxID=1105144 RepID=A0ABU2CS19_9MICO|nr:hypothetical protein [Promicromonospora iranensis]MDR7384124.1 hypothetical protein [Promicromonospora iranensis]
MSESTGWVARAGAALTAWVAPVFPAPHAAGTHATVAVTVTAAAIATRRTL